MRVSVNGGEPELVHDKAWPGKGRCETPEETNEVVEKIKKLAM